MKHAIRAALAVALFLTGAYLWTVAESSMTAYMDNRTAQAIRTMGE